MIQDERLSLKTLKDEQILEETNIDDSIVQDDDTISVEERQFEQYTYKESYNDFDVDDLNKQTKIGNSKETNDLLPS